MSCPRLRAALFILPVQQSPKEGLWVDGGGAYRACVSSVHISRATAAAFRSTTRPLPAICLLPTASSLSMAAPQSPASGPATKTNNNGGSGGGATNYSNAAASGVTNGNMSTGPANSSTGGTPAGSGTVTPNSTRGEAPVSIAKGSAPVAAKSGESILVSLTIGAFLFFPVSPSHFFLGGARLGDF